MRAARNIIKSLLQTMRRRHRNDGDIRVKLPGAPPSGSGPIAKMPDPSRVYLRLEALYDHRLPEGIPDCPKIAETSFSPPFRIERGAEARGKSPKTCPTPARYVPYFL